MRNYSIHAARNNPSADNTDHGYQDSSSENFVSPLADSRLFRHISSSQYSNEKEKRKNGFIKNSEYTTHRYDANECGYISKNIFESNNNDIIL